VNDQASTQLAKARLLHILSPALPTGAYSYSQGIETAAELGWLTTEERFYSWLLEQINGVLAYQELPLLARMYHACVNEDSDSFSAWAQTTLAYRDTMELRNEENYRAAAFIRIIKSLPDKALRDIPEPTIAITPLAGIAWVAVKLDIPLQDLLLAFAHSWLEASIANGVKLIPLGQSQGQSLLYRLTPFYGEALVLSQTLNDEDIGYSAVAVSLASCQHETQHTRIYRS